MESISFMQSTDVDDDFVVFSHPEGFNVCKIQVNDGRAELTKKRPEDRDPTVHSVKLIHRLARIHPNIGTVKCRNRSNFYAFSKTLSSSNPKDGKTVYIYSDGKEEGKKVFSKPIVVEELSYEDIVRNILIVDASLITVFKNKINLYHDKLDNIRVGAASKAIEINTFDNPNGLCIFRKRGGNYYIATLGEAKGEVKIIEKSSSESLNFNTVSTKTIQAHVSGIEDIAINSTCTLMATASENGTLIRIFDISEAEPFKKFEFRRGSSAANIYSLVFNKNSTLLACGSSNGTIHLFDLNENKSESKNITSYLSPFSSLIPSIFGSDWMESKWAYRTHPCEVAPKTKMVCKFDDVYDMLHVITADGGYYYISGTDYNTRSEKIPISMVHNDYMSFKNFSV
jgi:WD40 repeat protein